LAEFFAPFSKSLRVRDRSRQIGRLVKRSRPRPPEAEDMQMAQKIPETSGRVTPNVVMLIVGLLIWTPAAQSRVTKIVIDTTTLPATPAGDIGPYETLVGRAYGEIDPRDPLNANIQDLTLAPRNANGNVEYMATFRLDKPIDMSKSSGLLWHDAPNRGTRIAGSPYFGSAYGERDFGDVVLSSGWQGDNSGPTSQVLPNTNFDWVMVPVATNPDGTPIKGAVLGRIVNRSGPNSQTLNVTFYPMPYRPASLDTTQAILTTHAQETINGVVSGVNTIASSDWAWAKCSDTNPFPGTPDPTQICLKNGFDPALVYQVVFTAANPYILGVGLAAFRDVGSFFKNEPVDDFGTPNPIAGSIQWSIARGYSQSGAFLRALVHLGLNQDEVRRQVYDGMWQTGAGSMGTFDFRWALPDGTPELYQAGNEGPKWWEDYPDDVRGRPVSGMLDRCRVSSTCPKIIEHYGSADLWFLRVSPAWVGTDVANDIPIPDNVRRYYLPSTTHLGGSLGGTASFNANLSGVNSPSTGPTCRGNNWGLGALPVNPLPYVQTSSALRVHVRDWVISETPPPASRYPTVHDGILVPATKEAMGFPSIPGLPPSAPTGLINPLIDYDFGADFNYNDQSGVPTNVPPLIKQVLPALVPRVDADGNEVGGVPLVLRDAPLGTYLGWNITAGGFHQGQICTYDGGMIPFARTQAERLANGDPRRSLEERYGDHAGYVAAVQHAADNAVAQGFLLDGDAKFLVDSAQASSVLK
jgi:hypothetical protein